VDRHRVNYALQLANGRRVELTLADEVQLPRIVKLLEQPA
jgi:hypothetical protein